MSRILERIEREAGVPGLASILSERLSPTDLQSLLLEVYRARASQRQPSAVLADYEADRFVGPASVSPISLLRWEQTIFSQLPEEFQPVALSPVCPLGTNSAVAPVDQNWAVSTIRNSEVVSDSTNVLALECAVRRRELLRANPKSGDAVHLATSHRLLRGQRYEGPGLLAHFSAFALCSAGRDRGNRQFEMAALALHIRAYLRALRAFAGPDVPLHVSVSDFETATRDERIETRLLSPLRSEFQRVTCVLDAVRTSGRGYYDSLCFKVHATAGDGRRLELADGGVVDWTQKYLSNAKERLVISGIGSERIVQVFGGAE
jgi:hypothetical protein